MPLTSFRNLGVLLGGQPVLVESVDVSSTAQIIPVYDNIDYTTNEFSVNGPQLTSIRYTYGLTGNDPLFNLIEGTGFISGNIAGFYFREGYLKSYSLDLEPNNSLIVNAELNVYDQLSGSYSEQIRNNSSIIDYLDSSNIVLSNGLNFNINTESILGLRFGFENELVPSYSNNSVIPTRVASSRKTINCEIDTDSENIALPWSGNNIAFDFSIKDQNNNTYFTYNISGKVIRKNFRINSSNPINTFSILQPTLFSNPIISGFNPRTGSYGHFVSITGSNFQKVSSIYFYDLVQNNFTFNGVNIITTQVPVGALSGDFGVIDQGGKKYSAGTYGVVDPGITIISFSPSSGAYGINI